MRTLVVTDEYAATWSRLRRQEGTACSALADELVQTGVLIVNSSVLEGWLHRVVGLLVELLRHRVTEALDGVLLRRGDEYDLAITLMAHVRLDVHVAGRVF